MNAGERSPGRTVAAALLVVVSVVAVAASRTVASGEREMAAADASLAKGDRPGAIAHARAAAEALAPGSPWPARGMKRLAAIGYDAETRDDEETALLAYGAILTAEKSTRGPIWKSTVSAHFRATAEEGLARVAAGHPDPAPISTEAMLEALRHDDTPGQGTWALLTLSTLSTLAALAYLALFEWQGRRGTIARAVAVAGFVVYAAVLLMN
ncbi:MAG: hypothetical protein ACREJ3_18375 [Polyangiaceae bacterium]